ncbi:mitochondrial 2-oxoglutarate/malate carrier [Acrasis kona]|uniref:Mitochondrial 2-oxoglutarate/malate carrier n=1 Tax=Acrasis kona TaxID=1008807 RepID=A0AAW2ZQL8_9EUKA
MTRQDVYVPPWQRYLFSTTAPMFAVVLTNPFDTCKVRLQLQGQNAEKVYSNTADAFVKIFKAEGITGLQKGLTPAFLREGSKNFFRIGFYDPLISIVHKDNTPAPIYKRLAVGMVTGGLGALSCNPFELVKTRMQASANKSIAVGHQHTYNGVFPAIRDITKKEGFLGLYKGSGMSFVRSMIASGLNLSIYTSCRDYLLKNNITKNNSFTDASCSLFSSFFSCLCTNPIDVVRTRIYNQKMSAGGMQYKNGIDAATKIIQHEGVRALGKGFLTSWIRMGPHFTLTFVFYEQMKRISASFGLNK